MIRSVLVLILVAAGTARAGICPDDYPPKIIASYEAHARKPVKDRLMLDDLCIGEVQANAALHKRFVAACTTILAREDADDCVIALVELGDKQLGDKPLLDYLVAHRPPVTWQAETIPIYETYDDPSVVPVIVAAWKKGDTDKTTLRHTTDWRNWRVIAARILRKHGGAGDLAFIDDELATTKDKTVVRALRAARDAIGKRLTP